MTQYQFYLESCEIMDTRSYHEDTIIAGIGVIVNGRVPTAPVVAQVGNHNNGTFAFWQKGLGSLDNIEIGENDFFAFNFQLFNNGHSHKPSTSDLEAYIDRDLINAGLQFDKAGPAPAPATTLPPKNGLGQRFGPVAGSVVQKSSGAASQMGQTIANTLRSQLNILIPGTAWSPAAELAATLIPTEANLASGGLFSAIAAAVGGCDGPLGMGLVTGYGLGLEQRIPQVGPLRLSANFNAKQLGFGHPCNPAGSNFVVNVIIQRRN